MRTVAPQTYTSLPVLLAIDSPQHSSEVETRLTDMDCACEHISNLFELEQSLQEELPSLLVLSLELDGKNSLDFFRKRAHQLSDTSVVFVAANPSTAFEQSLSAIRLGALDVIVPPIGLEKLADIAQEARQKSSMPSPGADASFYVQSSPVIVKSKPETSTPDSAIAESNANDSLATRTEASRFGDDPNPSQSLSYAVSVTTPGDTPAQPTLGYDEPHPQGMARRASHGARVKELESWILGSSPAMQAVRSIIAEVAETKANVMIYGASGTGKELVATAVHKLSKRSTGPFEPVNMTEIPHDLAESLLFGHEKGAFTGADYRQIGVCEAADGGTLFLDEIGEMSLATQPKLLRFLQEGTVKRIGSRSMKKVDVRVITATNRTPETIVKEGLMREDLFFRLHVVPIHIPPLHERPEDIEQLATLFLKRYVDAYERDVRGFTDAALDIFRLHDWPGNVRQLENVVERLVVFAKGTLIDVPDIPSEIHAASMFDDVGRLNGFGDSNATVASNSAEYANGHDGAAASAVASMSAIQRTERSAIIEALQRCDGHVIDAAHMLGLGQATVYRKIKQYHIPHQRRRRRRKPK